MSAQATAVRTAAQDGASPGRFEEDPARVGGRQAGWPGGLPAAPSDRLAAYGERVFGYLPRSDQRRWAGAYLRGLLHTPGRKTVRRMAETLGLPDSAPQALQQFITASPWEWTTARAELARIALELLPDAVWTAQPVPLRKRGSHSVGLRPRLLPGGARPVNCQVGIGLFLTDGRRSVPVAWRLLLDDTWCGDPERRRRARIPPEVSPAPAWALVLEMLDQLAARGVGQDVPLVLGPGHARGAQRVAAHLAARGRDFVLEVPPGQQLGQAPRGAGPAPAAQRMSEAAALVAAHRPQAGARPGPPHLHSTPVLMPAQGGRATAAHQPCRLVAEVGTGRTRHARYWVTSLRDTHAATVRALAHRTAVTDASVRHIQNELGLLDFEGRSFPGWHHHMTLASAAWLYHCGTLPPLSGTLPPWSGGSWEGDAPAGVARSGGPRVAPSRVAPARAAAPRAAGHRPGEVRSGEVRSGGVRSGETRAERSGPAGRVPAAEGDVRAARAERPVRAEHPEHVVRPEQAEPPVRAEHPEHVVRPEHGGRPVRAARPEDVVRPEQAEPPVRAARPEHVVRPEHGGRPVRAARPEHVVRPEQAEHPVRAAHPQHVVRAEQAAHSPHAVHPGPAAYPRHTAHPEPREAGSHERVPVVRSRVTVTGEA